MFALTVIAITKHIRSIVENFLALSCTISFYLLVFWFAFIAIGWHKTYSIQQTEQIYKILTKSNAASLVCQERLLRAGKFSIVRIRKSNELILTKSFPFFAFKDLYYPYVVTENGELYSLDNCEIVLPDKNKS